MDWPSIVMGWLLISLIHQFFFGLPLCGPIPGRRPLLDSSYQCCTEVVEHPEVTSFSVVWHWLEHFAKNFKVFFYWFNSKKLRNFSSNVKRQGKKRFHLDRRRFDPTLWGTSGQQSWREHEIFFIVFFLVPPHPFSQRLNKAHF